MEVDNDKVLAEDFLKKCLYNCDGKLYSKDIPDFRAFEKVMYLLSPFGRIELNNRESANPFFIINDYGKQFISQGGWAEKDRENELNRRSVKGVELAAKSSVYSACAAWATFIVSLLMLLLTGNIHVSKKENNITNMRSRLYDNLLSSGKVGVREIGTKQEFLNSVYNKKTSKEFYQNLISSGLFTEEDIGTEEDFYNSIKEDFK